jgi:hypothetical protein
VREVPAGSAAALVTAMGADGDRAGSRLARGCRCFAAFLDHQVVAYGWLSTGVEWIGEIRLEIQPAAGEAYVWNCLTLPAHRRRGIFGAVLVRICADLQREGLDRLWIASGAGGTEKPVAAAGFCPTLLIGESPLGLAGLRLVRAAAAPGAEPGLVSAARRVLAGGGRPLGPSVLARRPPIRKH